MSIPVHATGRRFAIEVMSYAGPWISCGVHLDFGAPHVALHIGVWTITIGWVRYATEEDRAAVLTALRRKP